MPDLSRARAYLARLHPLGRWVADASYFLLATTVWVASSVVGALGLLLGFVIIGAGGRPMRFFGHVQNLATHYLFADPSSRARFDGQLLMVFLAVTGLLMIARLPGFLLRTRRELARGGIRG